MKILHVFDNDGQLRPGANIKLWATMLVPEGPANPGWQLHVDAQVADAVLASGADGICLDRGAFSRLYSAGRTHVDNDQRRRQRDGEQVGDILLLMVLLDRNQPERASLGKAMRMHARDMARFSEEKLRRVTSKLRESWREFEAAAPLWGAYRLLCRSKDFGVGATIDWPLLLALAERFRVWAEAHHSPLGRFGTTRTSEPLLARHAAWHVPAHAVLPHDAASRLDRQVPGRRFAEVAATTPA